MTFAKTLAALRELLAHEAEDRPLTPEQEHRVRELHDMLCDAELKLKKTRKTYSNGKTQKKTSR